MIRDINNIEDDIIDTKRIIDTVLCGDPDIIEALDNKNLDASCPEEYLLENIFPFIRVPYTNDVAKNYICYSVDDVGEAHRNDIIKQQDIQFVIFVHKDLVQTKYGMARHDLMRFLIRDIFNRSHLFGHELKLISDREGVTDTQYYTRTMRFRLIKSEVPQDGVFENRYERLVTKNGVHSYERISLG